MPSMKKNPFFLLLDLSSEPDGSPLDDHNFPDNDNDNDLAN